VKKIFIALVLVIGLVPFTLAYDLSEYPLPFFVDNKPNSLIVIGNDVAPEDIIGASSIAGVGCPRFMEAVGTCKNIISTKRDNELSLFDNNMIIVGGPCANKLTAQIMNLPTTWSKCAEGFEEGTGMIKLYNKWNKTQLVVAGYSAEDTRKITEILANYKDYNLSGKEIEVSGNINNPIIHNLFS
jgi:hypothetical protein